jgi:hypothetical protein
MINNATQRKPMIWWILWFVFLLSIPQYYFFFGKAPSTATSIPVLIGVIPFVLSGIVRWVILPRIKNAGVAFALFIVGIAVAEACCFFGLFLIPAHKQDLFILSILGIVQFAPFFARKYNS